MSTLTRKKPSPYYQFHAASGVAGFLRQNSISNVNNTTWYLVFIINNAVTVLKVEHYN